MVKVYTAMTTEIDDPQAAVKEIREQLNPEKNALKNTVGIVNFYHEFAETDTLQAIADALPFESAGCVSSYIGAGGMCGDIALSVTMLTSDDAYFSINAIENLRDKTGEQIGEEFTRLCADLYAEEKPQMVIPFLPLANHFTGDNLVEIANGLPESVPLFGTIAYNMEGVENAHYVYVNGKASAQTFAFIALYGNVNPKFHYTNAFIYDNSFGDIAEVSDAENTILKAINGITALEYLKKKGMITDENNVAYWTSGVIPAILTYPNGTKIVRQFLGVVEGTEYIHATGFMKSGAKIEFANIDGDKTLLSAEKILGEMYEAKSDNTIMFSCAGRAWSLGVNFIGEAEKIAECVNNHRQNNNSDFNYCLSYSGGEILPVWDNDGKLVNTLQNYTLIACTFN
ncbi:MAG: FIST C-terminal domain-containing protein [Oscillospiraceae bacterium]|nr:FIST C-terminal domain-containing protein [Oscillospiraceae bacterium]